MLHVMVEPAEHVSRIRSFQRVAPHGRPETAHDRGGLQARPGHIAHDRAGLAGREDENVVPVPADSAVAGDITGGHLEAGHGRQRGREQALLERGSGRVLRVHQRRGAVRRELQQFGIVRREFAMRVRPDMQHAEHAVAEKQRHAKQRPDSLSHQYVVQHVGAINMIDDHWPPLGGDPAGETLADREAHPLAHLLLQPDRGGGDQLLGAAVEQQHRHGVGAEQCLGPIEQLRQELAFLEP